MRSSLVIARSVPTEGEQRPVSTSETKLGETSMRRASSRRLMPSSILRARMRGPMRSATQSGSGAPFAGVDAALHRYADRVVHASRPTAASRITPIVICS